MLHRKELAPVIPAPDPPLLQKAVVKRPHLVGPDPRSLDPPSVVLGQFVKVTGGMKPDDLRNVVFRGISVFHDFPETKSIGPGPDFEPFFWRNWAGRGAGYRHRTGDISLQKDHAAASGEEMRLKSAQTCNPAGRLDSWAEACHNPAQS